MPSPVELTGFEVVFGIRTGVTVLLPRNPLFDLSNENGVSFKAAGSGGDVLITTPKGKVVLKGFKKDHLEESISRGFIMFYEMEDEEVVRCTKAAYAK